MLDGRSWDGMGRRRAGKANALWGLKVRTKRPRVEWQSLRVARSRRCGFTLLELVVVIAVTALLLALLLPAVVSARAAIRRIHCGNNLRQIGLALHAYHISHGSFPSGYVTSTQTLWTGMLLPYLDQGPLYDSLEFGSPWDVDGSPNERACETYLSVYRCPSSMAPMREDMQGIARRVPCNYLACATGLTARESGRPPLAVSRNLDGLFFRNSHVRLDDVLDGTSVTVAVGEAEHDTKVLGIDQAGTLHIVDHWYVGSPHVLPSDASETIGSLAARINALFQDDAPIDEKELCFGSRHSGGASVVFADGHVAFLDQGMDPAVRQALGTRAGGEIVGSP